MYMYLSFGELGMCEFPSLWMYPVFRMTVAVVVGICGTDWMLEVLGEWFPNFQSTVVVWGLLAALGIVFLVMLWMAYCRCHSCRCHSYRCQVWFGVLAMVGFVLIGGCRLAQERSMIDVVWDEHRKVYVGEVMTPPVKKGKLMQAEVLLSNRRCIVLSWMTDSTQRVVRCGDRMMFAGIVARPVSDVELTGFDYANYLYRKGISGTATVFVGDWAVCERKDNLGVRQLALRCREQLVNRYQSWGEDETQSTDTSKLPDLNLQEPDDYLKNGNETSIADSLHSQHSLHSQQNLHSKQRKEQGLKEEELAVIAALTVGEKGFLTDSLKEMYSAAGVSHVLALSGLHIGILSAILYFLTAPLKRLKGGERLRMGIVLLALWCFAFVTGLSPSVVRAVVMCSLYGLASCLLEERFSSVYVWVLAAFGMLLYQPLYLFDLSCQLSFLAVGSILYFYPLVVGWVKFDNHRPLRGSCQSRFRRLFDDFLWMLRKGLAWMWNAMAVSISAQLGTLPLVLYYFGTFPTYFLVANLIVAVLAVCVLGGSIVALIVADCPFVGTLAVGFLKLVTRGMNRSIAEVQQWTGAQVEGLSLSDVQLVCGMVGLITGWLFIYRRRPKYLIVWLVTLNVAMACWTAKPLQQCPRVVYMNRSNVYLKEHWKVKKLASSNGLYTIDSLRIGVLTDSRWRRKEASPRIKLDYLYLCRGFKGNVSSLLRVFECKQVILDKSLGPYYQKNIQKDCEAQGIHCLKVSLNGSFRVPLSKTDVSKKVLKESFFK